MFNWALLSPFGVISVLYQVKVPDVANFALYNVNFKSWNWLAVQIVPFCDLNNDPPIYCFVATTSWTSGRIVGEIAFWPIVEVQSSYLSEDGASITIAYSFSASKNTGDENFIFVAIGSNGLLSLTLISFGLRATWV